MRDPFGLPIRNEILSGALTLAVAALDKGPHSHPRSRLLPRPIRGDRDADSSRAELQEYRANSRIDDAVTSG